jgi:hypothetical protein
MTTRGTIVGWERGLDENLRALAHLPVGTALGHVPGELAREFLELVASSDGERRGLRFVEEHCREQAALLAGGLLLDAVSLLLDGLSPGALARIRESGPPQPTPEQLAGWDARRTSLYAPLLGGLIDAGVRPFGESEWLRTLAQTSVPDVRDALAWCRRTAGLPPSGSPGGHGPGSDVMS